jgi:ATP-binding cassette, subfamily F, member 3
VITLKNIELRRAAKVLLKEANATINPGEKVALVGRNGTGKSSLFALLKGELHEDRGDLSVPPQWRLGEVEQHMPETSDSATEFVVQGDSVLAAARAEVAAAEAVAFAESATDADHERLAHAYTHLHDAGEHDARPRAQSLILGLGFRVDELDQPVNSFSGGWRMRLQLARALMCPADLLLLDEPTNHLDLDALVWLEGWLARFPGTMLVISHDRDFLDAVTQVTLHIDQQKITRYGGNYSKFEDMRAERASQQQAAFARQQEQIAHLQKFIDRFKAKATKAKQAQSRVKALERMEKVAPLLAEADFNFEFAEPPQLPNPMLVLDGVEAGYPAPESAPAGTPPVTIVRKVNRSVLAGQRIGILGANGQGKSTLVKTIADGLLPLSGTMTQGKGLNIGYFAQQELDVLRSDDSPLEHMLALAKKLTAEQGLSGQSTREQDLRNALGSFNFSGDMVHQAVGSMSGGEKARLVLCMLVWQRPNLLLLDEPTNHLDLATREALAVALNEFEGSLMLVSHDRALLRSVCDEFWMVTQGGVQNFDGDLQDYQAWLLEEAKRQREAHRASLKPSKPDSDAIKTEAARGQPEPVLAMNPPKSGMSANRRKSLQKELGNLEIRMAELQSQVTRLEVALAQASAQGIAQAGQALHAEQAELQAAEERWLALTEELEAAGA